MTTPLIPWFISDIFKAEVNKIQVDVVDRVCQVYGLDKKEVLRSIEIPEIKFKDSSVRIIRKYPDPYGSKSSTEKCPARVYDKNERTLCRCKRSQREGCNGYCKSHYDVIQRHGKLVLGTVDDPVPLHINGKVTKKIY